MLRITLPTASLSRSFILEGRLAGLWAKEFLRVARAESQGRANIFDLREVLYVDSEGEEALRWLGNGKDLCNRLKLQRVEDSQMDKRIGTRPEHSPRHRQRQAAHTESPGAFATADANQHSPSYRGVR